MTAQALIKRLENLPPRAKVLLYNGASEACDLPVVKVELEGHKVGLRPEGTEEG